MKRAKPITSLSTEARKEFLSRLPFIGECWDWQGMGDGRNYGAMYVDGSAYKAHRLSFFLFYGYVAADLEIDHLCGNTRCVNPTHLELVPQKENMARGTGSSAENSRKTHCKRGHELNEVNTYSSYRQKGWRVCKVCARAEAIKRLKKN